MSLVVLFTICYRVMRYNYTLNWTAVAFDDLAVGQCHRPDSRGRDIDDEAAQKARGAEKALRWNISAARNKVEIALAQALTNAHRRR